MTTVTDSFTLDKATTFDGTITKSELFRAYNRMRAIVRKTGDQKAMDRLNKALGILQSKAYYAGEKAAYTPTRTACGCKDWQYKYAKKRGTLAPCKHIFAEMLIDMILKERAEFDVTDMIYSARHVFESSYRA